MTSSNSRAASEPQLAHDYHAASEFLRCLDPDAEKFTFQCFKDPADEVHPANNSSPSVAWRFRGGVA